MYLNAKQITSLMQKAATAGVDVTDGAALDAYVKAHMKEVTDLRENTGWLYQNGPFSMISDDILSLVVSGGSALVQWMPTRLVGDRFERVSHLEWVAPKGFDGSQTYRDWLATITIADCDYGPTTDWSGFEYQVEGGRWSFQSPVLHLEDFGQKDYERSPIYTVRGDQQGLIALDNDADWGIARALMVNEQHVNYNYVFGDRNNSQMEIDGIDQIVTPGYVQLKRVGKGIPHFANPLVINGAVLTTVGEVLTTIRAVVRKLRGRAAMRQWGIGGDDMAIALPLAMWVYLAEGLALDGGGYNGLTAPTPRDFREERDRILTSMSIPVDGIPVRVLLDGTMGKNVTLNAGDPTEASAVAGDIFILTRRAGGETLLEAQFLDWRQWDKAPPDNTDKFSVLGGIARAGWKETNSKCFQWFVEMGGRLVSRFQPMQARINNVVIPTLLPNENEAMNFTAQDFFAYDGQRGGEGTALLTAV